MVVTSGAAFGVGVRASRREVAAYAVDGGNALGRLQLAA